MDGLIEAIGNKLLNEAGLVAALLLIACVYLSRQWAQERKAHAETIAKLFSLAKEQAETSAAGTEALHALKSVIERDQILKLVKGG